VAIIRIVLAVVLLGSALATSPVASATRLGDPCDDWMKLSTDAVTGEEMFCAAAGSPATDLWWRAAADTWGNLPKVGAAGSPCSAPKYTTGQSSDGYVVWCTQDLRALLPGDRYIDNPQTPVWSVYAP
jgi:hypothetical protein